MYSALTSTSVNNVWKLEENPSISFWVTLFTCKHTQNNQQTDRQVNNYITSVEGITSAEGGGNENELYYVTNSFVENAE